MTGNDHLEPTDDAVVAEWLVTLSAVDAAAQELKAGIQAGTIGPAAAGLVATRIGLTAAVLELLARHAAGVLEAPEAAIAELRLALVEVDQVIADPLASFERVDRAIERGLDALRRWFPPSPQTGDGPLAG